MNEQKTKAILLLLNANWTKQQIAQALDIDEELINRCLTTDISETANVDEYDACYQKDSFNFTKDRLVKIEPPQVERKSYKDTKEKGLTLTVFRSGVKVFYLYKKIDGKPYRIRIGHFPDITIQYAREKVIELKNQIAKGVNPAKEKAGLANEMTFKEFLDKYINDYAKHKIKRWEHIIPTMDRQAKKLYNIKLSAIQRGDIQKIFNELTVYGKITANRFVERLSSMFNKAIAWGWEGKNPTIGITKHTEKSRDRYLSLVEAERFFEALKDEPNEKIRDYILLSLYTGARKSNVLSMNWENINLGDKTWYIPETKNGQPQLIPLLDEAVEILKKRKEQSNTEWVFPSDTSKTKHLQEPRKGWVRVIRKAGIKDIRLHDLRRTLGSWMAHAGASQYIIGKALNHKDPKSTAIYARLSIDPAREFMSKALRAMRAGETNFTQI